MSQLLTKKHSPSTGSLQQFIQHMDPAEVELKDLKIEEHSIEIETWQNIESVIVQRSNIDANVRLYAVTKPRQCSLSNKILEYRCLLNETSLQCSQCYESFSQKSNLVNHLRTHTYENPFQCSQCNKSFS